MSEGKQTDYRKRAIKEYGKECARCEKNEEIVVHHRNGDRSDNRLENLIPLCTSCHGKVHGRSDELPHLVKELGYKPRGMEPTSIGVSEELADELHERKQRGDSYEDVIWRLIDVPGEHRLTCGECGFDGGTYDFKADPAPPNYCPECGAAVDESESISTVAGEDEPTALSWRHTNHE